MDPTKKEVEMNLKKIFLVKLLVVIFALSFSGPAFSQSKTATLAGVIQWVSPDFKYIALPSSERSIPIPPDTKVFDEKGNSLKLTSLRKGLNIVMESTRNPDGSMQRKIIVKN